MGDPENLSDQTFLCRKHNSAMVTRSLDKDPKVESPDIHHR
jgi:hypothetical protein